MDQVQYEQGRKRAITALCNKPAGIFGQTWLEMKEHRPPVSIGDDPDYIRGYNSVLAAVADPPIAAP